MSISALSRQASVSRQTIYRIEAGDGEQVTLATLQRLATALGVAVFDLLVES